MLKTMNFHYYHFLSLLITLLIVALMITSPVFAGGGRYRLESYSSPGFTGNDGIYIQAWITTQGQSKMSVGEKAEFRIQNPRSGDRCITTNTITNENGLIFGQCFATTAGEMLVFVHSFDMNEDSSPYILYFQDKPTPTTAKIFPTVEYPTKQPLPTKGDNQISPTINNENNNNPSLWPTETIAEPVSQNLLPKKKDLNQLIFDFIKSIISKLFKR